MFLRTSFEGYQERAEIYISEVVSRVKDLQWYTAAGSSGGPIIMTQVRLVDVIASLENLILILFHLDRLKMNMVILATTTVSETPSIWRT